MDAGEQVAGAAGVARSRDAHGRDLFAVHLRLAAFAERKGLSTLQGWQTARGITEAIERSGALRLSCCAHGGARRGGVCSSSPSGRTKAAW